MQSITWLTRYMPILQPANRCSLNSPVGLQLEQFARHTRTALNSYPDSVGLSNVDIDRQQQQQQQHQEQPVQTSHQPLLPSSAHTHSQEQEQKQQQQQQQHRRQQQQQLQQQQQQQQQRELDWQAQLQRASHWRQLVPLTSTGAFLSLLQLVAVLGVALDLQPTTAIDAAATATGLAVDQQLFEQQQYVCFLQHLLSAAAALLKPKAKPAAAAAAAATAAKQQELLLLLRNLVRISSSLRQQLHSQLQQLPIADALQQQCKHYSQQQAVSTVVQLALLKPHLKLLPLQLQQQLFAAAVGANKQGSKHSKGSLQKHHTRQPQQQQQLSFQAAAHTLWAAARLGWQPQEQHIQQAVSTLLLQLPTCSSSELAMGLWGVAKLGVGKHPSDKLQGEGRLSFVDPKARLQQLYLQLQDKSTSRQLQLHPQQQQQQQREKQPQVSSVLSAALLRHCMACTSPELVGVVWASAELQLLPDVGLMRGLLQALSRPGVLLQCTGEDLCSVLWALARMHQKRATGVRSRMQCRQQQLSSLPEQQHQQGVVGVEALPLVQQQQQQQQQEEEAEYGAAAAGEVQEALQQESLQQLVRQQQDNQGQQQWHAELQEHWYGEGTPQQQQQQLEPQQQQHQPHTQEQEQLADADPISSSPTAPSPEQQQQQLQRRRQRAAVHAQQLQQPDLVPPALVAPLLAAFHAALPLCSSACIARILWSVSVLRVRPDRVWMSGVLQELRVRMEGFDGTSCMLVALALCRLRYLPEGPWLKAFWAACVPLLPQPQQQQDGAQQQQQVLGRSSVNSKKHRRSSSSSSRSSRRSGRGSDVEAGSRVQLSQAELVVLVTSAYELSLLTRPQSVGPWKGQKPPRAWLDGVAAASAGYLSPQTDLSTLLCWGDAMLRFSSMAGEPWPGPGASWWQGFEAATEPYLHAADPKELLRMLKLLSMQQQHRPVSSTWVQRFLEVSRGCLLPSVGATPLGTTATVKVPGSEARPVAAVLNTPGGAAAAKPATPNAPAEMEKNHRAAGADRSAEGSSKGRVYTPSRQPLSARNLVNLGRGVAGLGVLPDKAWTEAWELGLELTGAGMSWQVNKSLQQTRAEFDRLARR